MRIRELVVAFLSVSVLVMAGCSSDEADASDSSGALSCVPNQELVCLCGLEQGVQKCSKSGKLGKCECSGSGSNSQDEEAVDEGSKPGTTPKPTPSPTPPKTDGGTTPTKSPATACNDTADAFAAAAQRCGDDPQEQRAEFVTAAAGGSCNNIKSVRDINTLYANCIPWFKTVSCVSYLAGIVDPSCQGQLLR